MCTLTRSLVCERRAPARHGARVKEGVKKICLEAEKAVLFEKCKHVVACEACARQISECPLCRKKITRKVKVFL